MRYELLIAKFRLKLKKVGKTSRPFRYDLNQIPKDYSGSGKEIQGIRYDRVPDEPWMVVHDIVQETGNKTILKKKKCKTKQNKTKQNNNKNKTLQIAMKRSEKQRRKGKIYPLECRVPKNSKER